jgi:hypothetical protein
MKQSFDFKIRWLLLPLVILLQISAVYAFAGERPVIREVLVAREGNGARIEIRADLPLDHTSYLMPELTKWVIDLPGAKSIYSDDESKKMKTPPLERITVRQKEVNGEPFTRIGLDFKGEVDFSLKEDPLDRGHLLISLIPAKVVPVQKKAEEGSAKTLPKTPEKAAEIVPPSGAAPAASPVAKTVTTVRITADTIRIEADGKLVAPSPFLLNRPGRLVVDLAGVTSSIESIAVPANRFGIVRSRLGNSGGKLRMVFEVNGNSFPDFQLKEIPNGVEILPVPDRKQ